MTDDRTSADDRVPADDEALTDDDTFDEEGTLDDDVALDDDALAAAESPAGRDTTGLAEPDAATVAFWEGVGVEPVLLCLPRGTGYTLRQYRDTGEDEEVEQEPVFLGSAGRVYSFTTPASLVAFVRGAEPHDLSDAVEWERVRSAEDLDVTPERLNRYELDLVVEIARAGADGWGDKERETLLLAGEVSRDIAAYAELTGVQEALGPGSPLDELDDDLRQTGFMARRRLRRYTPEQIALGWRRVIREIDGVVDLRD